MRVRGAAASALAVALVLGGCTSVVSGTGVVTPRGSQGAQSSPNPPGSAAPTPPLTSPPPAPHAAPAQFFDCRKAFRLSVLPFPKGREKHLRFDCALVPVPLDYADPSGTQIRVAMVRVHDDATGGPRTDLLVNPGGPGGSGIGLAVQMASEVSDRLLAHDDIVGFDPRGVGSSAPIRCLSDQQKDMLNAGSPDVVTRAGYARAARLGATYARACAAKYGAALQYFDTVNTARDLDQLRAALGDRTTDYLGFSYGTELGSVYAHLFPSRVGQMVLDGVVDPLTAGIRQETEQLRGFELAFGQFSTWCRRHAPCRSLGNPAKAVEKLTARAGRHPIPAHGDPRKATPQLVVTGTFGPLYEQTKWPALGHALVDARRGDSAGLLALADAYNQREDGHYTNLADANVTISCNDARRIPSDARIRSTARRWAHRFPVFGPTFATGLFTCQKWQPHRTVPPRPTASTPHTVLVVGNVHDPATPYKGAQDMTRVMGRARLLTWNGEGHTSYLKGSSCVDRHVDDYLISGTLPATHTVCPR